MWPQYLMTLAGVLFFVGLVGFLQINVTPSSKQADSPSGAGLNPALTLAQLFHADFSDTSRYEIGVTISVPGHQPAEVRAKRFINFSSRSKFLGFYIPSSPSTYDVAAYLADGYKESLQHMDDTFKVNGQVMGEQGRTSSDDLIFVGRIFIYHEDYLSPQQVGSLIGLYESKKLDLKMRSQEYVINRNLTEERKKQKLNLLQRHCLIGAIPHTAQAYFHCLFGDIKRLS